MFVQQLYVIFCWPSAWSTKWQLWKHVSHVHGPCWCYPPPLSQTIEWPTNQNSGAKVLSYTVLKPREGAHSGFVSGTIWEHRMTVTWHKTVQYAVEVDIVLQSTDTRTWVALSLPIKKEGTIAEHWLVVSTDCSSCRYCSSRSRRSGDIVSQGRTACHNLKTNKTIKTDPALLIQTAKRHCLAGQDCLSQFKNK